MIKLKDVMNGLGLAVVVGILGQLLSNYVPSIGAVTLAIIIGIIVGNFIKNRKPYEKGIQFTEKKLLPIAIMLLGVELQLNVLIDLGFSTIFLVIIMVFSTIAISLVLGKILGFSKSFSILMGTGNAVCGSSAIAAVAPIVKGEDEEIGISIGVVNLMGTIGIFLLPLIASMLRFETIESGAVIGGTLQAVGQVVAAGFSVNDNVGNIAVLVKMGRVLMLGPVVLIFSTFLTSQATSSHTKGVQIPPFILGFFLFSVLASSGILAGSIIETIKFLGKTLLVIAMAGIGLKIKFSSLLKQGPKALVFEILIATLQIVLAITLAYVLF